jgi:hypothetical protein
MLEFILKRMTKKARIATYLAALPTNGKRDDELELLIYHAYQGKKHIHGNPIKKEKVTTQQEESHAE